jgi:ferredoxin
MAELNRIIEEAKTGRARCRGCRQNIAKGELRFGEEAPNDFDPEGGGTSMRWFHLGCAADQRPALLKEALAGYSGEIPDRAQLEERLAKAEASAPPPFPYAEHAPTGRSRCGSCGEQIEKGAFRVAYEREIETGMTMRKGAGYLHLRCAPDFLKEPELVTKLQANSRLPAEELSTLSVEIGH